MKSLLILTALFAAAVAVSVSKKAPLLNDPSPSAIDDEYIVIFEDNIEEERVRQHHSLLDNMLTLQGSPNNKVMHHYHIGSFRGYSVHMHESVLDRVRDMEEVKYVERNLVVKALQADCIVQPGATWGIVRTTHRDRPDENDDDYKYDYYHDGYGVEVFILDTGIDIYHPDFRGRAVFGADFVGEPEEKDQNGHGTHCAGTVMSDTWGLAKEATAIAVKVLGRSGSGSFEGVIAGINWVAEVHRTGPGKSVVNMSLGGGRHQGTNDAVEAAVQAGVHFAIAAGNEGQDACNVSPGSAENAVTVAASDSADQAAYFTNWGKCVDIVGPGVSITSTWLDGGLNTISGTSMAAPHVAGVMAKYLSAVETILKPQELKDLLSETSTEGLIGGLRSETPNKLVYNDCEGRGEVHGNN